MKLIKRSDPPPQEAEDSTKASSVERKIDDFCSKFGGDVASPWDGKKSLVLVDGLRLQISNSVPKTSDTAELCLPVKNLDAILRLGAFDKDSLLKDSVISPIEPSSKVAAGSYRPLDEPTYIKYPTGILTVDLALQGGFVGGYVHRIWGSAQSLKSLLLYKCIIEAWNHGIKSLIIAGEYRFDIHRFKMLGGESVIAANAIKIYDPGSGEEALDEVYDSVARGSYGIVGIDSITSLKPLDEIKKGLMKAPKIGAKASMQTRFLERVLPILYRTPTALICLVQAKNDTTQSFGTHDSVTGTFSGGEGSKQSAASALEYYSAQSLKLHAPKGIRYEFQGGPMTGHVASGVCDRNSFGPRGRVFEFFVDYTSGIDDRESVINLAITRKIVRLEGRSHIFPDGTRYKTSADAISALKDRGVYWQLHKAIMERTL